MPGYTVSGSGHTLNLLRYFMSSTGRSDVRQPEDYYITPIIEVVNFLRAFEEEDMIFNSSNLIVLDPCAGGDEKRPMSYPTAIRQLYPNLSNNIQTIDIRKDSPAEIIEDYLVWKPIVQPDIIITNPPFKLAIEVIQKALKDVKEGGYVIMLLRLNFFGSQKRFPFFLNNMPKYAYVHHKRISFTGGSTDSTEYMHAVWIKGEQNTSTQLRII